MPRTELRGLYAITDERLIPPQALPERVEAVLRGGARLVQYRAKQADDATRLQQARTLAALCREHDALFIVNDDPELAHRAGAHGVHLGRDDAPLAEARELLGPDAVIGVTCHDDLERARRLRNQGADYLAFGRLFPSRTKPEAPPCPLPRLGEARALGLPVCAIGGIDAGNARQVIAAGADLLAVIHGLFGQPDPEAAARRLTTLFRHADRTRPDSG